MKILVCKTFGLGNAVMCIPMLKALRKTYPDATIDVIHGHTSDDMGVLDVFSYCDVINARWMNHCPLDVVYDYAICAIPYDGRWHNGKHFNALHVMDGRTRPDPTTIGLSSWKKHEVEYQMENAFKLGYDGDVPSCSLDWPYERKKKHAIFLGIGYKKDADNFWRCKHWGNENYVELVKMILDYDHNIEIVVTGDALDVQLTIAPLKRMVNNRRLRFAGSNIQKSIIEISECHSYVGNDTGMMHIAAAFDIQVLGLFMLENSITKNRPWCNSGHVIDCSLRDYTPIEVFEKMKGIGII